MMSCRILYAGALRVKLRSRRLGNAKLGFGRCCYYRLNASVARRGEGRQADTRTLSRRRPLAMPSTAPRLLTACTLTQIETCNYFELATISYWGGHRQRQGRRATQI